MLRRLQLAASAAFAAVMAAAAVGCSAEVSIGDSDQVQGSKIAAEIRREYAKQQSRNDIRLSTLTCEEVEAEVGARIRCSGRNSREIDLEIGGEVTAVQSDGLDYNWRIARAFAPGTFYASAARDLVEAQLQAPVLDVRCPVRIELGEGEQVSCEAELSSGRTVPITLLLTDSDGGFRLRSPEQSEPGSSS